MLKPSRNSPEDKNLDVMMQLGFTFNFLFWWPVGSLYSSHMPANANPGCNYSECADCYAVGCTDLRSYNCQKVSLQFRDGLSLAPPSVKSWRVFQFCCTHSPFSTQTLSVIWEKKIKWSTQLWFLTKLFLLCSTEIIWAQDGVF